MFRVKTAVPNVSNFLFKLYSSGAKGAKKAAVVKEGGGCKKKADASKGKKGKMCGKPKAPPAKSGPPSSKSIVDKCDMFNSHETNNANKWKLISYCLVPFAFILSAVVLATAGEHPEPDYIPYEYMYKRTHRFAWRDGRTSLFHGPYNLIPDEEEERIQREQEEQKAQAPPPKKGAPAPEPAKTDTVKYKKRVNEDEEKIKKREQHAEEELERRKRRHEKEKALAEQQESAK